MARKIKTVGITLIVLIIIAALAAMSVVQAINVAEVSDCSVVESDDTSVSLSWKKVASVDGYYIYQSGADKKEFEKAATINDSDTKEYTVKNLEQATEYNFYITAFRQIGSKIYESKEYSDISICTSPSRETISSISSPDEGNLELEWKGNSKAAGYHIQYVEGEDFSKAETVDIKDKSEVKKSFEKLNSNSTYSVRVCSYIYYNDKCQEGEWSDVETIKISEKVAMPDGIDPKKPMIALTFDDGPGYNSASDKILDVLEKYNAKATFFMVGVNAKDHPKNLKRKIKLGCELGNHTYKHNHYGKNVTASDISKASKAIYDACGQYPTAFRSTGGNTTGTIRKECESENMPLYYWSLDTLDWKTRNAGKIYKTVMKNIEDGDIVLMHDIYPTTADAVEKMVPELIKKGYQLVTVSELVKAKTGKNPVAGEQYVNGTKINNQTS